MKRWKLLMFLMILAVGLPWESFAQSISNRGKDFWVSYPFNWFFENNNSQEMVLYFSAEENATVTLTSHLENGSVWQRIYNVAAGTVVSSEEIPKGGANDSRLFDFAYPAGNGGQGLIKKAIHINSTAPIVAYAHYMGSATSGAAMLLPVESWGQSYITINNKNNFGSQPSKTYFYITAAHDNTVIQITPKALSRPESSASLPGGRPAGVPFTVSLNKGECYQYIARNTPDDLTGSRIKSVANSSGECFPVAVYAGTSRTTLGCSGNGGSGDFIMQQCFPTQAWGSTYFTVPASNSSGANSLMMNIYRVLIKDPATVVKRNGVVLTGLVNGDYYEFNSGAPDYIEADKPVMVAQYMPSAGACTNSTGDGDPEMIYISPREQAINKTGFYRNKLESINSNYLTLVIPNKGTGLSSLKIDGVAVSSMALPATNLYIVPHPQNSNYSIVVRRWVATQAQCMVESDSAFTAITYGLGSVESYGYNAGTYINNLSGISELQNVLGSGNSSNPFTCINSPVKISVLMRYKPTRLEWKLSLLSGIINPAMDIVDNAPVSDGSVIVKGEERFKYTLSNPYNFSTAGTHEISILASHPSIETCDNTEEIKISVEVKGKPEVDFTVTHPTGCLLDTVYLKGPDKSTEDYTISNWSWSFPGGQSATGNDTVHVFGSGADQPIKLSVFTTDGCTSDTVKLITVYDRPTAALTMNPPFICEGGTITFTPTYSYDGTTVPVGWYWDLGNNSIINTATPDPQSATYDTHGQYTVNQVVKISDLCISDTIPSLINIYAKPVVDITYPAGCLPINGVVQFTNNTATPDGQTLTTYNWNFGDAASTPVNPNTSADQSPSHIYTTFGNYDVTYRVTSSQGCVRDTVIKAAFNVSPQIDYPSLNKVCENVPAFSIATANVTNGVPGTGVYSGPGTSPAGMFDPAAAGPGVHTITYTFTSTANCVVTQSQNITVNARPFASFTIPGGGCLPVGGMVTFNNISSISSNESLNWLWSFDDPNASTGNQNTSTLFNPSHAFTDGSYKINLRATSAEGCAKDTTVTAVLSVTPQINYPLLAPVCQGSAALSIANATVTNAVPGTGIYSGPGVNAAGGFDPGAAGAGTHIITYAFTSTNGCTASQSQTIVVYPKPVTAFDVSSATGCLPSDGLVSFINTSSISGGHTLTYLWNFGDPNAATGNENTSTSFEPSHNFRDGVYDINLIVASSQGCKSELTINKTFAVNPVVVYPAISPVCESAAPYSIATATVNGAIRPGGIYSGTGVSSTGMFDPAAAGAGLHTVTYSFTTTSGCTDTKTSMVQVYPRPVASFTTDNDICRGESVTLTNTSTISSGIIQTWNWDYGNGNTGSFNNGNSFGVIYNTDNNYTVNLVTISDRGCSSLSYTQPLRVHPLPVADFTIPTNICLPGAAKFQNTSRVSDNSAISYVWEFGDGTGSATDKDPLYTYTAPGSYPVRLAAITSFGCENISAPKIVSDFYIRPTASFTVAPSEVCQGGETIFTDASTPANSIVSWKWDFGDGKPVSADRTPIKVFSDPGVFNVSLVVTSNEGCASVAVPPTPVTVHLQPKIDAGRSFVVAQGTTVQFEATANSPSLTFNWTNASLLSDATILRPTMVANQEAVFVLTATGEYNCTSRDELTVRILRPVNVPNVFSPNGDNINDRWLLPNLADYPGCKVEVYNRYGQQVFYSAGYGVPWDGRMNGKDLPMGTYYYIIKLENGFPPINGSVTILR